MITVGQALVAGLAARGVEVVFGIPGVHTIELYRGLAGSGLRHVTARHEQGAGFMADGYARVSGKPGVAFVITGPGLTNTLTAMAQARADSVPMLVVSGVNRRETLGRGLGFLHEVPDQAGMVRPLCPTFRIGAGADVGPVLDAAFAAMLGGRPGPVHVEVPLDVMPLPADMPGAPVPVPGVATDRDALARAVAHLAGAVRPVILAGGGAARAGAALQAVAEALDAPVVQTVNARGLMHGHPLCVPASPSLDAVRALIAGADRVLAVGTEIGPTDYDAYARGGMPDLSGMVRVDVCAAQLARHPAAVAVQGEAAAVLAALADTLVPRSGDGAVRAAACRAAALAELSPAYRAQVALLEALREAQPGAILVGDSTQPVYAWDLHYSHDLPGRSFNASTGYGALGFAPGAAVGAALAAPGVPVTCLIGDGGLQFSPGELRTALDERLPVTFLVWNNAGFGEIADSMRAVGAEVIGCDPSPLRMEPFAAACDLPYARVPPDPAALVAALAALPPGPRLVEIAAG
jgi:acetolactate synthase-1/2/3 large subunit